MKPESKNTTDTEVQETRAEVPVQRQAPIAMSRFLFRKGNSSANITDNSNEGAQLNILPWRKRR
ncbi:hypothetical protein Desor_2633 [Desulfosporosinus orientis DSM 765]|uniref:Uncharacterized protein n=1 Tax=Desulfosporosinus orientis (strain ATCC 19365 / DSM 765 / NCIMB 8382 / VKM B-1628 / Singapore I) TaxID=768706 RepID=G7W8X2_DESOD|nr:hypothetical protein [Desulfosporosinus orientis]AET68181.1 hypothetical protein Desor_2633 [Desulfosporosinus orientis DSM 765]